MDYGLRTDFHYFTARLADTDLDAYTNDHGNALRIESRL